MTTKEFLMDLPNKVNPEALTGLNTNFHFDVTGDQPGQYTVQVVDGKMEIKEGFVGDPKCTIKAKESDLMGVVNGTVNPMMAVMMGKLKISNLGEMQKYAKAFGLM